MELLLVIGLVWMFFAQSTLRRRVEALEARERRVPEVVRPTPSVRIDSAPATLPPTLTTAQAAGSLNPATTRVRMSLDTVTSPAIPHTTIPRPPQLPIPETPAKAYYSEEESEFFLYRWFKEQTLIKIGAVLFFLGAVWFVGYAIDQNWLSPGARISLGLLGAVVVYGVGYMRSFVAILQYQVLTVLGTGIVLGTVAASQFAFTTPVIPAAVAFVLLVASVGYSILVALWTESERLALVAAVAGLIVPLLTATENPNEFLLLLYLFTMSTAFLLIGFVVIWHRLTIVLVAGAFLYTTALIGSVPDSLLWAFACLFTLLFTASVTLTIARSERPTAIDVSTITVILLLFLVAAEAMAFSTALAQFVAAAIAGGIAYWFRERHAHTDTVSLYALATVVLIFIATSNLLSGATLTVILAAEALLLLIGSCYVATVRRSVYVAAGTFVLPVLSGLYDIGTTAWLAGIWRIELFSTLVVVFTLGGAVVWLIEQPALRQLSWVRAVAGSLLAVWVVFVIVASQAVGGALYQTIPAVGFVSLVTFMALVTTTYVGLRVPARAWRSWILLVWLPALLGGLELLQATVWNTGITHAAFVCTTVVTIALGYITGLYVFLSRRLRLHEHDAVNAYTVLWVSLGYLFFWLHTVWYALYPAAIAAILQYLSYFAVLLVTIQVMLWLRVRFAWTVGIISLGSVPLMLSLPSYVLTGWLSGPLALEAIGVYVSTTLVFVLATALQQYRGVPEEAVSIVLTARVLFWIGGIQAFATVWIFAHSLTTSPGTAVTLALFVYTISGLVAFSYGRATAQAGWKRAGVLLLGAVVLRLGLVDFWQMEILWRIVTFLGIGSLFIVAALMEQTKRDEFGIGESS